MTQFIVNRKTKEVHWKDGLRPECNLPTLGEHSEYTNLKFAFEDVSELDFCGHCFKSRKNSTERAAPPARAARPTLETVKPKSKRKRAA